MKRIVLVAFLATLATNGGVSRPCLTWGKGRILHLTDRGWVPTLRSGEVPQAHSIVKQCVRQTYE